MEDTFRAWAAGFLDGEGCMWAGNVNGAARYCIAVAQVDRKPLELLMEAFGGSIYCQKHLGRSAFVWRAQSKKTVLATLDAVERFLIVKEDQAAVLRQLVEDVGRGGQKRVDHAYRAVLVDQLKDMKKVV
jgi:hypothetical protein